MSRLSSERRRSQGSFFSRFSTTFAAALSTTIGEGSMFRLGMLPSGVPSWRSVPKSLSSSALSQWPVTRKAPALF